MVWHDGHYLFAYHLRMFSMSFVRAGLKKNSTPLKKIDATTLYSQILVALSVSSPNIYILSRIINYTIPAYYP